LAIIAQGAADITNPGRINGLIFASNFAEMIHDQGRVTGPVNTRGGDGNDRLTASERRDVLKGDAGGDMLCGGHDVAAMNGGTGTDHFV